MGGGLFTQFCYLLSYRAALGSSAVPDPAIVLSSQRIAQHCLQWIRLQSRKRKLVGHGRYHDGHRDNSSEYLNSYSIYMPLLGLYLLCKTRNIEVSVKISTIWFEYLFYLVDNSLSKKVVTIQSLKSIFNCLRIFICLLVILNILLRFR